MCIRDREKVYSWVENVDDNKVEKTMALIWTTEGTYTLTKNLTEIWTFASDDEMRDSDTWSRILDLNDYERGEMITVSVRACADEATTEYRDGIDGVAREITLPNRLTVPDTANPVSYTHLRCTSSDLPVSGNAAHRRMPGYCCK